MKISAQKSLKSSQDIFSSIKDRILTDDSDVVIFGVDDSNASVILQLVLSKIASELGREIILPYDVNRIISLEREVISGANLTFEQLLFQAILSSGVSYSPAYAFVKSVDAKVSMVMKDREFGVEWAKRKKILDAEDQHIAGICENKLRVGKKVICVVSVENMFGVKEALKSKYSVQELSLLPEVKLEDMVSSDALVDAGDSFIEKDERERVVEAEPYTGGIDFTEHRGAIPSFDGGDNVSRQMEKALGASNIEEKITRLEELCLAIQKKHSGPGGRTIPTYWFDAADVVKRKRYFAQLASNIDINCIYELARTIYLNFSSIFYSMSSDPDTLILDEGADFDIDSISERVTSLQNVVIHSDFLNLIGKRLTGEEQERYINRLINFLREKEVNKLVIDFSTSSDTSGAEIFIASSIISKAKLDDDLGDLLIETIGADKLDINMPRVFSSTIDVDEIANWLTRAKLDDEHPLFLLKPIDFLFLLKDTTAPSINLMIGLECVKARIKELKDDLYAKRYSFRKGFPTLIKESVLSFSSSSDAQNYVFEIVGMKLRVLEDISVEAEISSVGDPLHSLYLSSCYSKSHSTVASSRLPHSYTTSSLRFH